MSYRVEVDQTACIGPASCVQDAPVAFGLNEARLAQVLLGVGDLTERDLFRVARNCPAGAIVIYDETGSAVDVFGIVS